MKRAPTLIAGGSSAWLAVLGLMTALSVSSAIVRPSPAHPIPPVPREDTTSDYLSSAACRSCHPAEYASWHDTYHRTMTQRAEPALVRAPDAVLARDGRSYTFRRRDGAIWASTDSPKSVERPVLLATGSHHYEGFWLEGRRPGELRMFPFVYLFAEARWIPRHDAFLQPEDAEDSSVRWNSNCIQCHATAGQPSRDASSGAFDTTVAELGIACEACHGPGGAHARRHRNPFERYAAEGRPDPTIVNPARLAPDRASMVCGQCHAYTFPKDEDAFWLYGYTRAFHPGQDLGTARFLISAQAMTRPDAPHIDADVESMFWPDGTVRVGGREYNGLTLSACFQRGKGERQLACASCHGMHSGEPAGQLRPDRAGDEACFQCHDDKRVRVTEHTHHPAESNGSRCVACHMPKTSYALLKSVRSHRIDSPRLGDRASDRPPACALCHLDRPRAWTADALRRWWGLPSVASIDDAGDVATGVRLLLAGNAAQRVIAAAAMGSAEGLEASGAEWVAPVLARALLDPYAAVRFVATRSLHRLPGFESMAIDPLAPPDERTRTAETIVRVWEDSHGHPFDPAPIDALVAKRDDRAITISE